MTEETSADLFSSDKFFEPYAKQIGFLLREWNSLQDTLGKLFAIICNEEDHRMGLAIWHAIPNDRLQRKMLKQAASCKFNPDHTVFDGGPKDPDATTETMLYFNEINWIICSADNLGPMRDASAHAPLRGWYGSDPSPLIFVADHLFGNLNAAKLKGKDLLQEFRLYRERAMILNKHATDVFSAYSFRKEGFSTYPFPKRPTWPKRPSTPPDE